LSRRLGVHLEEMAMRSVFTSLNVETLDIPGTDRTVTIRMLAPKHLAAARRASQLRSIDDLNAMGGPAFLKQLEAMTAGNPNAIEDASKRNPLLTHDPIVLMEHGVLSWTLDVPKGKDAFEELSDDMQEWLATEILKLAKPSLFQAAEETEEARKND
jgi:hypothetical protein